MVEPTPVAFETHKMHSQVSVLGETFTPSIQPNRPKRRSIFLESGLTSANSHKIAPVKFTNHESLHTTVIYDTLKPLYISMRLLGAFPASMLENQLFRMIPQWLAYSVVVFLAIFGYVLYIQWDKVEIHRSQEGKFEEVVIDYLFSVYLLPIFLNPIIWYETRKIADIINQWANFETIYRKVTKKKTDIFLGNKPIMLCIVLPLIASGTMIVTHMTMAHFRVVQVVPYCYINTLIFLIAGFWFMQCDVLGKLATKVAEDFQASLKDIGPASQVADYRTLWMLLSKLIRDIGNACGYTLTFLCLYLFLIITLTIYGLLSQLQSGFSNKDIGLTVNAALAILILYFICDEAHYASNCVRVQFQKKLLLVELTWMNDDVQHEINMFLRATEMSPTDITLVGFFDVNRNLFKSLLATMVTYLVVLLQFQISIPEETGTYPNSTVGVK